MSAEPDDPQGSTVIAPEEMARLGAKYRNDLKNMYASAPDNPIARRAIRIARQLAEPNVLGIYRACQVFDFATITAKAEEAARVHAAAQQAAPGSLSRESAARSRAGSMRTVGGVFFWLLRQHAQTAGLRWEGLGIPEFAATYGPMPAPPAVPEPPRRKKPKPVGTATRRETPALQPNLVRATPANVAGANRPDAGKPTRSKISITGTLVGGPHLIADREIVELTLQTEVGAALPKGIPAFGGSRVVVWCTRKQWERVAKAQRLSTLTRFVIEGEPKAAVGSDLQPFMRVACLKLSTVEIEQAARAKTNPNR